MTTSNSFFKSAIGWFRLVALTEGISYLLLLFIAMPLKYIAQVAAPVKFIGWGHGLLFVLYGILLIKVWVQYKWTFKKVFFAFIASIVPFGTFVLERNLKKEYSSL